jgi:guanylate kinase
MNVIVGISWPFANGELHIGHAASSLPGDVIARYHRLKGNNVILEIEVQGALQVKEIFPEALLLFVTPPSAQTLKERLVGRGTESEDVICQRLAISAKESHLMEKYDYLIVNDVLENSVREVHEIIQCEHFRTARNKSAIQEMQKELTIFSKGE